MKTDIFIIEGKKPFKVMKISSGYNFKPIYLVITNKEIQSLDGTKVYVTKKPTAYQRKKIYNYMKVESKFSNLN